jgi:uncharacterized damage-inducible protein DinB
MVERVEPRPASDERTMLVEFLDYYRASLELKTEGLTDAQAATATCPPSILTLTGLVRHMAEVERNWFRRRLAGEDAPPIWFSEERPDGDLEVDATTSLADSLAAWRAEIANADLILATATSLDQLAKRPVWDGVIVSVRWVLIHMIEEYARHCGHADLLRERIDGVVGD